MVGDRAKPLIFVVDDDPKVREMLRSLLAPRGYAVRVFASALDAKEVLPKELPDLIVSDYQMPRLDGVAFLLEVYRLYPSIKTILLTASYLDDPGELTRRGIGAVLPKPFDVVTFLEAVRRLVGQRP